MRGQADIALIDEVSGDDLEPTGVSPGDQILIIGAGSKIIRGAVTDVESACLTIRTLRWYRKVWMWVVYKLMCLTARIKRG